MSNSDIIEYFRNDKVKRYTLQMLLYLRKEIELLWEFILENPGTTLDDLQIRATDRQMDCLSKSLTTKMMATITIASLVIKLRLGVKTVDKLMDQIEEDLRNLEEKLRELDVETE